MKIKWIAGLLIPLITGCPANSGVIPIGEDNYMISRQQATGFEGQGNMRSNNIMDAAYYCSLLNKDFKLVSVEENEPPYVLGKFPRSELRFKCLPRERQQPAHSPEYRF